LIVINPTDKDISVQIKGTVYSVDANGQLSGVPKEIAEYWKDRTHNFITVEAEGEVVGVTKKIDEQVKEVTEDVSKEEKSQVEEKKKSTKSKK